MPNLQEELDHLAMAERHIVDGEMRVTRQALLIERVRHAGRSTKLEEFILGQFQASLDRFYRHRQTILHTIGASRLGRGF
jgi:hypothetical protein